MTNDIGCRLAVIGAGLAVQKITLGGRMEVCTMLDDPFSCTIRYSLDDIRPFTTIKTACTHTHTTNCAIELYSSGTISQQHHHTTNATTKTRKPMKMRDDYHFQVGRIHLGINDDDDFDDDDDIANLV